MSNDFGPLDGLTAGLWRELMLAALPIRIVQPEEWNRLTAHLREDNVTPNSNQEST
jgi:hypothetical protein